MVEKIIVNPESVRAYGNVVSPKTGADFDEYNCTLEVGEDTVNGETVTVYVLTPETTSISLVLSSSVGSCGIGDSVVLSVTVTEDSEPVSGASVSFKLGGSEIGTGTTNSSGVATYTYTTSSVGSLNFSAVYAGHSSNSVSVVVSHDYSIAFSQSSYPASSGSATLEMTLLDNSSPVSGATVAVTGSDSSTYSCTTNSSGVGTVTVSNISAETTFTATYQGVSDTCTVTVQTYLFYDECNSSSGLSNYGTPRNARNNNSYSCTMSVTDNSYYTVTQNTSAANGFVPITPLTGKEDIKISMETYTPSGGNTGIGLIIWNSTSARLSLSIQDSGVLQRVSLINGQTVDGGVASLSLADKWVKQDYTIDATNNSLTLKLYDGDTLVHTYTSTLGLTIGSSTQYGIVRQWYTGSARIKNIKAEYI